MARKWGSPAQLAFFERQLAAAGRPCGRGIDPKKMAARVRRAKAKREEFRTARREAQDWYNAQVKPKVKKGKEKVGGAYKKGANPFEREENYEYLGRW